MVLEKGGKTLAYDPDKDLTRLTNEALPNLEHYQNPQNKGKCRPRLEDLIEGRVAERKTQDEEVDKKIIKFGWMEGVLMRCLLNIRGTMLS